jgi:hypothetical protein
MEKFGLFIFLLALLANSIHVKAQDKHNFPVPPENTSCDSLMLDTTDIEIALDVIANTVFRFQQNIKINRSKGFKEASYFSCYNQEGYMVIKYHDCMYLYSSIPKHIWESMIVSGNPGSFFETNIRDQYESLLTHIWQ